MTRRPVHRAAADRALSPPPGTTTQVNTAQFELTAAHPAPALSIIHQVREMLISHSPSL